MNEEKSLKEKPKERPKEVLILLSSEEIGEIKLISGNDAKDIYEQIKSNKDDIEDIENGMVGQYLSKIYKLGDPTSSNSIWVLIRTFHEYAITFDEIQNNDIRNNIDALIFADNEKEAKALLGKHPEYLADIEQALKEDDDANKNRQADASNKRDLEDLVDLEERRKELKSHEPFDYIWNEEGSMQMYELVGDFVKVPEKYHYLLK